MTKNAWDPILRWRDRQPGGAAPEDRAAEMIRRALVPSEPDARVLASIEHNLRLLGRTRGRKLVALRLAVAAMFLVAGVATAKAYELARRAGWFERMRPATPPAGVAVRPPSTKRLGKAIPAPSAPNAGADNQEPAPQAVEVVAADPRPQPSDAVVVPQPQARAARRVAVVDPSQFSSPPSPRSRHQAEPAITSAAEEEKAFEPPSVKAPQPTPEQKPTETARMADPSDEIHAFDSAVGLLRRDHNAAAALPALDAYLSRYPRGVLNHEARLARIDALLMLGRSQEALAALDALPLDNRRRSTELQVVRGELRALKDCARAEEDFTVALAHGPDAGLLERILYDRGMCRARLENRTGAIEDLRRYLERFPNGTHAGVVRRWLDTINKSPTKGG
jgi:TolA-binding protein